MENEKIDFVLIWVDGGDPKWQEEKIKYSSDPNATRSTINRYRDWGLLKYWFRGVEKFAPWVNNIYFITCGHYPEWLNLNAPKLKFLKHEDYIPKEYLPTFNANPIETNFHRIEDLSDKFVFFNDDTFLTNHVKKEDFFKNNKPRYIAGCDVLYSKKYNDSYWHIILNDTAILNKYFNKKQVIKKDLFKWLNFKYGFKYNFKTISLLMFNGFSFLANPHLPAPMLKETMKELWKLESDVLEKTSSHKFRAFEDVNQNLFEWYDMARGNFEPAKNSNGRYFDTVREYDLLIRALENQKYKMICFSDDMEIDYEKAKCEVTKAFEKILPEKSSFEI